MPIDARIPLQGIQPEPLINTFAKMQSIRGAQQENAMRAAQMDEYQRKLQDQNALRSTLAGFTPDMTAEDQVSALQRGGHLAEARLLAESSAKAAADKRAGEKAELEAEGTRLEIRGQVYGSVAANPTLKTAHSALQYLLGNKLVDPNNAAQVWQQIQADPSRENIRGLAQSFQMMSVKAQDQLKLHFADLGGSIQPLSELTGRPVGPGQKKTQSPDAVARLARESSDSVEMSPEQIDYYANMYNQTQTLPSLGMGATPLRQKILSRAAQLGMADGASPAEGAANVVANAQTRAAEKKTLTAFTSGVEARRVTANNTAVNHLATMEDLADKLANSDIRIVNAAKQAFAKATGQTAPASFDAAKQLVAAEVIKAVVNNGGGVKEREEAAGQFARANSPEQLKGVIQTYKELLGGQLSSLEQQYETGTNRKDFRTKLSPRTRKLLDGGATEGGGVDTNNPLLK